ncbi:MAG: protoglobin domain-containing protein, partial [Firmicutes bacterium]|nr:protoglobin domain-containing protein [Bacillota bacterium]
MADPPGRTRWETLLDWSDAEQSGLAAALDGRWPQLADRFAELVTTFIAAHPPARALVERHLTLEEHAARVRAHVAALAEDPRSPAAACRSRNLGLALVRAGVRPSWFLAAYQRFFAAVHECALPVPLDLLRRRWQWDSLTAVDAYFTELQTVWAEERGRWQDTLRTWQ